MSGVGEDERPYNYICNLDKVNLGGPGWFNDVFKVSHGHLHLFGAKWLTELSQVDLGVHVEMHVHSRWLIQAFEVSFQIRRCM